MILIPPVNTAASYMLIPRFAALNGIYTLTKVMSFDTAIADKVDFEKTLYALAGLTEDDYLTDWQTYQTDQILQLTRCRDATAIAAGVVGQTVNVPESLLQYIPDPMVRPYDDIYLAINIGPYADPEKIDWLRIQLNDLTSAVTGTADAAAIMSVGQLWLTDGQYASVAENRDTRIRQITPQAATIIAQQDEIARLRALIAAYEQTLVALSTAP